jgi:hypothetical protein
MFTASKLREDIYNILDSVIQTGEPVEIERKGKVLRIILETPASSKSSRIKTRPGMLAENPESLSQISWAENWSPEGNF